LNQLIDRHPHNAINYNNRGLVYFQSSQLNQALADYNTAIQLNPHLASAWPIEPLLRCMWTMDGGTTDYDKALDLNPSYVMSVDQRYYAA